jgi:hypothetical protein
MREECLATNAVRQAGLVLLLLDGQSVYSHSGAHSG